MTAIIVRLNFFVYLQNRKKINGEFIESNKSIFNYPPAIIERCDQLAGWRGWREMRKPRS
jgi:hypothetical protein